MGGIAARRAARAAACRSLRGLAGRPEGRLGLDRPERASAGPGGACGAPSSAGEDVTDRDSIAAGRIRRTGPDHITVFRRAFCPAAGRGGLAAMAGGGGWVAGWVRSWRSP